MSTKLLDVSQDLDVRTESLETLRRELLRGEVLEEGGGVDAGVLLGVAAEGGSISTRSRVQRGEQDGPNGGEGVVGTRGVVSATGQGKHASVPQGEV